MSFQMRGLLSFMVAHFTLWECEMIRAMMETLRGKGKPECGTCAYVSVCVLRVEEQRVERVFTSVDQGQVIRKYEEGSSLFGSFYASPLGW